MSEETGKNPEPPDDEEDVPVAPLAPSYVKPPAPVAPPKAVPPPQARAAPDASEAVTDPGGPDTVVEGKGRDEPELGDDAEQVGDGLVLEKPKKAKKSLGRRLLKLAIFLVFLGGVLGASGVAGIFWYYGQDPAIPTFRGLEDYRPPLVTDIQSGDDQLIGEFFKERRRVVPYDRIPKKQVQAFLATEDNRFFEHMGIDPVGMVAAVVQWAASGFKTKLRGASTLTQQTAKAILVTEWGHEAATARTIRRKVIEMILAFRLEEMFTKEQILGIYLNHVYLGHHSYGVQSAAENYFRKNVEDLTLGEMSLLAGLPQAPSAYSPYNNPERARKRRQLVLLRMVEVGYITEAERDAADAEEIQAYPIEDVFRDRAPFFTEHVRRYVVDNYGNERLLKDGLKVYTTVDLEKQRYAQSSTLSGLNLVDKRQGYAGPLMHVPEGDRSEFTKTYDAKVLEGKSLEMHKTYVGLVTSVSEFEAKVKVGRHEGTLPLIGMRWARKPDPNAYYPSALITDVRKALKKGDAILVMRVERDDYPGGRDPAYLRKVPKEGLLLRLEQEPELQGALVSIDPNSAYVVAMIGGLDFELSEYNRAFQACRQPGSSFKPIVYSAALQQLEWTPSQIIIDAPIVTDDPENQLRWKPSNYGMDFQGEVTLRSALVNSMNIPAVKVLREVGVDNAIEWAHRLGITTEINKDLSIALGSSCVKPWDLTRVYAMFNRYGKRVEPIFVRRVEDRDGNVLEDNTTWFDPWSGLSERIAAGHARLFENPEQVIPMETAFLTTYLMHHVVMYGTGAAARALQKPAAGKTGTTNDSFDAWFMGFTRDLVTGVWIGYDRYDHHPMARYENGGRSALPIWLKYMKQALEGREQGEFVPPSEISDNMVQIKMDLETGKIWDPESTRPKVDMWYIKDTEPEEKWGEVKVDEGGFQELMTEDPEL